MNKDTMETKTDWAEEEAACAAAPEEPMEEELAETGESAAPQKKWKRLWTRWKGSKKARIITIVVVVFLVLVLLLRACSSGVTALLGGYTAQAASMRDITVSVTGTGTVQPIHSSTIVAMVTGDILSDSFEIGDHVEKDQVLYVIDAENAQTAVEQAQLAVDQANVSYQQALRAAEDLTVTSTVSGQVSSIEVKQGDSVGAGTAVVTVTDNKNMTLKCDFNAADAQNIRAGQSAAVTMTATGETLSATVKNVSGYTAVGAGGTLVRSVEFSVPNPGGITGGMAATARVGTYACQSGGTFEYATQTQVLSKASGTVDAIYVSEGTTVAPGTRLVHLEGSGLEEQVESAGIAVRNAELSLRTAQDALESYQIKAPISGTVTQKDLSAGDNIGQVGTTTMAVISDLSALTFDMLIDELDIPQVQVGQRVEIEVDALPGRTFTGYVDKININGNTANGVTNYPVTIMIEDPDSDLLPGMNVSAEIVIDEVTDALTIPVSAVQRGDTVLVVPESAVSEKDGSVDLTQAKEVQVKLGSNNSDYVVVLSGLEEGDLVLVPGAGGAGLPDAAGTQDDGAAA